jgi:hypothetical protein
MKQRYEQGEIDGWELAKGALAYLRYKAGLLDITAWSREAMLQFEGESEASRAAGRGRLHTVLQHRPWRRARTCAAPVPGQRMIGRARPFCGPLAKHLGIDHFLYTRLEVEDGRFTGRVIEPVCFEAGKIHWLEQLVTTQRIDLARSWFYTDSITDLPLLELVGHPVVTNPDPRLYREAARRRWPVRFFTAPDALAPTRSEPPR